ncbi:MAG: endolysin, partial [Selenomonadaceae bacterium]|nr:endolysin [Selenomonadaceae bacterium]
MRGVDVSVFNDPVDWLALKDAGIEFAICRTGYGKNGFDETFQRNVDGAHGVGMKCGAYHYSY